MPIQLVMTVLGKDRTGIVESIARLVVAHGGNWLESRMCHLGGEFAGILRIQVPNENQQPLTQALEGLDAEGLNIVVRPDQPAPVLQPMQLRRLNVVGHDRPGILSQISAALARQGVNVEELETECASAPMSGEILFKATARLQIPADCKIGELCRELETIAGDLMVDVSLAKLP